MQVQTLNIALPKLLVKQVDVVAKDEYRNRSELIREALRVYLKNKFEWEKIFSIGKTMGAKAGARSEKQINNIVSRFRHG